MHGTSMQFIKGILLGIFFIGTISLGQFIAPTGSPAVTNSNSSAPINTGSADQIKDGDLGASYFTANSFCLGAGNCISDWWPVSVATSCKLEVKHLYNSMSNLAVRANPCEFYLSDQAVGDGWISTSVDNCTGENGNNDDCDNGAHCSYMRLVCTGSATSTMPITQMSKNTPMPYNFNDPVPFVRLPECNDGIDQPSPDADVSVDFPNDLQCWGYADDNEAT